MSNHELQIHDSQREVNNGGQYTAPEVSFDDMKSYQHITNNADSNTAKSNGFPTVEFIDSLEQNEADPKSPQEIELDNTSKELGDLLKKDMSTEEAAQVFNEFMSEHDEEMYTAAEGVSADPLVAIAESLNEATEGSGLNFYKDSNAFEIIMESSDGTGLGRAEVGPSLEDMLNIPKQYQSAPRDYNSESSSQPSEETDREFPF